MSCAVHPVFVWCSGFIADESVTGIITSTITRCLALDIGVAPWLSCGSSSPNTGGPRADWDTGLESFGPTVIPETHFIISNRAWPVMTIPTCTFFVAFQDLPWHQPEGLQREGRSVG